MKNLLLLQRLCSSAVILFSFIMLTLTSGKLFGQCTPIGDTSVYGNHVWNVYAFNAGGASDQGHSWNENYSGFYVDTSNNFATENMWPQDGSPSDALGYAGCPVAHDNHSWSARRKGFVCGIYQIDIAGHDDEAQLFVNGQKVWEHIQCCDSHMNVWSGFLGDSSTVVFRVTQGVGGSNGSLFINLQPAITPVAFTNICPGSSMELHGVAGDSYLWSTGETTQTITVTSGGTYWVSVSGNMCTITDSIHISVAQPDTPQLASNGFCPGYYHDIVTSNYDPLLTYTWNSPNINVYGDRSYFTAPGNYIFTATHPQGCSASSHITIVAPSGESDFGNRVWQVNAYVQGSEQDYGSSWKPQDYAGFYNDSTLNFDSQNKWDEFSNPSTAPGYQGCGSSDEFISWSAKREGFPCGIYQIDVLRHDNEAQLFIDGVKVWDEIPFTADPSLNVWTGALNASSRVEFRVTDAFGASNGALNFTLVGQTGSIINVTGNQFVCTGQSYSLLSIQGASYLWSNGETANPIHASQSGSYTVTLKDADGCVLTSDPVSISILSAIAPVAHITSSSPFLCEWNPVTLSSDSSSGNQWSTNETTQSISAGFGGIYILKVTNSAGCFAENSFSLGNRFTPPMPIASSSDTVCQGNTATLSASGLAPGGQVASFDGVSQYVVVDQDIPEYDFTIEMWIKTSSPNTGIFCTTAGYPLLDRAFFLSEGNLYVQVYNSQPWNTGFKINDGMWHHIAMIVQTGVGQIAYVDGFSSGIGNSLDHSELDFQTGFEIGFAYDQAFAARYFNGQIDNVRIWGEARSQSDIRNNMMLETPLSSSNLIYQGLMDGNIDALVGNDAIAPSGISYSTADYFTYSWSGNGAPSPSTSETQTISAIPASGTYTVTATTGGCSPSPAASTSIFAIPSVNYAADLDGDGFGSGAVVPFCINPGAGYVTNNSDCNDANNAIHPGSTEVCNSIDDNCNGQIDEGVKATFYADADHDGYGNTNSFIQACTVPAGYSSNNTDCNDVNASIHAGANDICNSIDDNCNGVVDENAINATINPGGSVSFCSGSVVNLIANTGTGISYQWMKNSKNVSGATYSAYTPNKAGSYKVKETNSFGCTSTSAVTTLVQISQPAASITALGNLNICGTNSVVLKANSGTGLSYQWQKNSVNISGATNQTYTATAKATYKCIVTNTGGCSKTSNALKVTKSCREDLDEEPGAASFNVYPNPSDGNFIVTAQLSNHLDSEAEIILYNPLGQIVFTNKTEITDGQLSLEIKSEPLLIPGIYILKVITGNDQFTSRVLIQ